MGRSCGVFGQRPIHFEHAHLCAISNRVRSNQRHDTSRPLALETKLGWVLSRPAAVPALTESCTVNLSATHVLKIESADISHVQGDLPKFWDL